MLNEKGVVEVSNNPTFLMQEFRNSAAGGERQL